MGRVGPHEREGVWYEAHDDSVQILDQERHDEELKICFVLLKVTLIALWHVHMG